MLSLFRDRPFPSVAARYKLPREGEFVWGGLDCDGDDAQFAGFSLHDLVTMESRVT